MDEPRRALADLGLEVQGPPRRRGWTQGPDAMGAIAARAKYHRPDPELAAVLVQPNGFALPDPLGLVARGREDGAGSPDAVRVVAPDAGPQVGRPVAGSLVDDGRRFPALPRALGAVSAWVATHVASSISWAVAGVCGLLWLFGVQ
jgi:hypothetical protein